MHPFSILTLAIFIAGYITARWDLVTRLYELAIFAADHGVVVSECMKDKVWMTEEKVTMTVRVDSSSQRSCHSLTILFSHRFTH